MKLFKIGMACALSAILLAGCGGSGGGISRPPDPGPLPEGLQVIDVVYGSGAVATRGRRLTVNYSGFLQNGAKFDSSYDRGQPFSFTLGTGTVIQGWEFGMQGMRVGGRRTLIIAPELAYGAEGTANIPPNSTLVFDVVLENVE